MQTRKLDLLLLALLLMSFASLAKAAEPLRNFVPGSYALTEGEEKFCGEGKFYVSKDAKYLWLGPYYSFHTSAGKITDKGGLSSDKGCVYESVTQIESRGRATIFTNVSTQLCGKTKRQVVTNEATIEKHKIVLEQTSTADPRFADRAGGVPHHCAWRLTK